jgi:hypothetical protein
MSGGIHFMTIATGKDTLSYEMKNSFDSVPLKIVKILNSYLPPDQQIWASEDLIKEEQDCLEFMKKSDKEEKK